MSDDFDVITGPAAPLRRIPPASLPPAPAPAPVPISRTEKPAPPGSQ